LGQWTVARRRNDTLSKSLPILSTFPHDSTLFFTYLRRTSGTSLENFVLIPLSNTTGHPGLNCKENFHARFYEMEPPSPYPRAEDMMKILRAQIKASPLQYRHCPYGLHKYLPKSRPYSYITVLREPFARMKVGGRRISDRQHIAASYTPSISVVSLLRTLSHCIPYPFIHVCGS